MCGAVNPQPRKIPTTVFDKLVSLRRIPLDRFIRVFLFPLSTLFALAALLLAVQTYSDLRHSSISSAFVTVQAVQEAYALEKEYPDEVVLASTERKFEQFWIVSAMGDVLVSGDRNAEDRHLDADIWRLTQEAVNGNVLDEYRTGGDSYLVAGTLSASGEYWTIVLLSPPLAFPTAIWLVLAILALSLMSVSGLIAVRYLGVQDKSDASSAETSRSNNRLDLLTPMETLEKDPGGDGLAVLVSKAFELDSTPTEIDFSSLHEAVLEATDDFVIMVDRNRRVVYSSPVLANSESECTSESDGLTEFADHHLDEKARMRFENWLKEGPEARSLTMDVVDLNGHVHPSRWYARNIETKSGLNFEVFIGRRLIVEEFPVAVNRP